MFISYTDIHHNTIRHNHFSGEVVLDSVPGIKISYPWVQVVRVDNRPFLICVTSSSNNITCGLYSFNFEYYRDFIVKEGIEYYWWSNRFSYNSGHRKEYRGLVDILKGYTLDGTTDYKFIIEYKNI